MRAGRDGMSKRDVVSVEMEDVAGGFARLCNAYPKEMRARISVAVLSQVHALAERMMHDAPVGPDAPHIAKTATFKHNGLRGEAGYIDGHFGEMPAGDDNDATIAEVALYNEYNPNHQPFMRPAAEAEARPFGKRVEDAANLAEKMLGGGL